MKKIAIGLFVGVLNCLSSFGQTVVWQMEPTNYDEIVRVNNNLYKVTRNGKVGLIHSDGTVVAPVENDGISSYYEHKALVTCTDGKGERVMGCLTDEGKYYSFSKKYYTLSGQKFFSDDALSVSDESGRLGYIDYLGNVVTGFDGKYDKIKPFVEGFAAVFKNKKYNLIAKDGAPVHFTFKSVGEVYGGTNVSGGQVYVWDANGKFYTYDVNKGGVCKSVKAPSSRTFDYLYRFSCVSGKTKDVPFVGILRTGVRGISVSVQGGLYGYLSGETIILPYQFSSAFQFEDGYAIVGKNGAMGILKYVDGSCFGATVSKGQFDFYVGNSITCQFNLSVPGVWRDKEKEVVLKESNGTVVNLSATAEGYSFTVKPQATMKKEYSIAVYAENLKLYEGTLSYSFVKKELAPEPKPVVTTPKKKEQEKSCPTCGKKISECEYQGVH